MKYLFATLLLISLPVSAFMSGIDESRDSQGELVIHSAHIPLAPPGMMNAGYLIFKNNSNEDIGFEKFTSPVYDSVQVHGTEHKNGVAKMKHVDQLVIPANTTVNFEPGGMHLMLMGPRRDINVGEEIMMIGLGTNEKRYMIKFKVIDPRADNHNHNHHH
tara:strand:+ start:109 stop:588 length:480 start_codon:yes stop_codon:yes gene_type:complete